MIETDPITRLPFAPEKAAQGQFCNGCGQCCVAQRCEISVLMFGPSRDVCPVLEWDGRRYWCGLVKSPSKYFGSELRRQTVLANAARRTVQLSNYCNYSDFTVLLALAGNYALAHDIDMSVP